jgi:hypothetical protein
MNEHQQETIAAPMAKIITAWAAVGITSWADAASAAALFYTMLLISEWFWKKFWRPLLVRRGFLAPLKPKHAGDDDAAE